MADGDFVLDLGPPGDNNFVPPAQLPFVQVPYPQQQLPYMQNWWLPL